jgi:hypothetical protein
MAEFGVQSQDDQLPVTALLPASVLEPVVIYDDVTALRLAVVERQGAVRLSPDQWDRPGVYVPLTSASRPVAMAVTYDKRLLRVSGAGC